MHLGYWWSIYGVQTEKNKLFFGKWQIDFIYQGSTEFRHLANTGLWDSFSNNNKHVKKREKVNIRIDWLNNILSPPCCFCVSEKKIELHKHHWFIQKCIKDACGCSYMWQRCTLTNLHLTQKTDEDSQEANESTQLCTERRQREGEEEAGNTEEVNEHLTRLQIT